MLEVIVGDGLAWRLQAGGWGMTSEVAKFYDAHGVAMDGCYDVAGPIYPAAKFRLEHTLEILKKNNCQTVLDVGCGTGIPLEAMTKAGMDAEGFDFSEESLKKADSRNQWVWVGDMADPGSYRGKRYDAVVCVGPLCYPADEKKCLANFWNALKPGGTLIVELRNELFSLFTFNRYTQRFLERELIVPSEFTRTAMDKLAPIWYERLDVAGLDPLSVAARELFRVPALWKNPLTVDEQYKASGFDVKDKWWFHWHAVPPVFERDDPASFRRESLALEGNPHDWRGMFMCSAFLVEATKGAEGSCL